MPSQPKITTLSAKAKHYHIVLMGPQGVGKTSIQQQFFHNFLYKIEDPFEDDCYRKNAVVDGEDILLEFLDTTGQEEYTALRNQWIRESQGILLIYSITSKESFGKMYSFWLQIKEVKEEQGEWQGFPILLVGNKTDLTDQREVSTEEGDRLASRLGCYHAECSAKMALNVHETVYNLARKIRMFLRKDATQVEEEIEKMEKTKSKAKDKSRLWKRLFSR